MRYPVPTQAATVIRRYKRFLVDVELAGGEVVTAHCPNPGRMTTCIAPGAPCLLTPSDNPRRKLRWTLEQVRMGETWIMVHPGRANAVVAEAVAEGRVAELVGYEHLLREKPFPSGEGRVDLLLLDGGRLPPGRAPRGGERPALRAAWVEIKSATLREGRHALFPDAVTTRGRRHLAELERAVGLGHRGVLFFLVSRSDTVDVGPADEVDPAYGEALRRAVTVGVEVLAYRCLPRPTDLSLGERLPLWLP